MSAPTATALENHPGIDRSEPTDEDYRRRAEDLIDELFEDRALCPWCFARKRTFYPEFDLDLANRLYRGPRNGHRGSNKMAFSAMGHSLREDGSLQVNSATSTADPSTYREVVPPTWLYGRYYPPRSRTICECGVIDVDFDDSRSKAELYTAIENISGHLEDKGYSYNLKAGKVVIEKANERPELASHDRAVLKNAIYLGLKHADGDNASVFRDGEEEIGLAGDGAAYTQ